EVLEERYDQGGFQRGFRRQVQHHRRHQAEYRLPEILPARRQAAGILFHHLAVVINPADGAEADGDTQYYPDVEVAQVGPEQGADGDGHQDQRATHGRRAFFRQVRLRTVVAHGLADLAQLQGTDHPGAEEQRQPQGSEHTQDAAQGEVLEYAETGVELLEILSKYQQHVG